MSLNGYHVSMSNRTMENLRAIQENNNQIEVEGEVQTGTATIHRIGDLAACLQGGCQLIMICVPATAHKYWAQQLLQLPRAPRCPIVLHPGQMHGALEMHCMLTRANPDLSNTVCELASSLLTCRRTEATDKPTVHIAALKSHLELATIPAWKNKDVLQLLSPVFRDYLVPKGNVLHTSLLDLNGVVHPTVTLLNSGSIDRQVPFKYYKDGITERIAKAVECIDRERMELAKALAVDVCTIKQWVVNEYQSWGAKGDSLYELLRSNDAYERIWAPKQLDTRYVWEDIPTGVLPMLELASKVNVKMPVMNSVYLLACAMFPEYGNFTEQARTLEHLGLGHLSYDELFEYVHTGDAQVLLENEASSKL